jgi:hypothetical protein
MQVDIRTNGVHESTGLDFVPRPPEQESLNWVTAQEAIEKLAHLVLAPNEWSLDVWQVDLSVEVVKDLVETSSFHGPPFLMCIVLNPSSGESDFESGWGARRRRPMNALPFNGEALP